MELHTVDYTGNDLQMNEEITRQTERVRFYTEHPFLKYREEPEEDDSDINGPEIRLYGVPKPFRLEGQGNGEWYSRERRSAFWGETQRFYMELYTPGSMTETKLSALFSELIPQMNEALKKAEAVPMAVLHAGAADYVYDAMREEVDADNKDRDPDDQLWLPPRERFGEVIWPTGVYPKFTLNEDGTLTHRIAIDLRTHDYYIGDIAMYAYIEEGVLLHVDHP
ncbi:hypothetical protein LJC41_08650 [Desulfosarcina sp. OttesenSCG-928-G17]|nr:hypothetical protein [Desulfosarcina sp. OttesenSCG-928-G17]